MSEAFYQYDRFNDLWNKYHKWVFFWCLRYAYGDIDLGQDFSQEVAMVLFCKANSVNAAPGTLAEFKWVRRVTHTTLVTHSRKAKIDLQPITDETERIIAGHNNENYELIKDLVAHLPDDDRQAVRLFLEGYSYKEIAAALGITESNVKVRFHRIKQKLKEIYTKLYGNEK